MTTSEAATYSVQSTHRLTKEMAEAATEIVVEQLALTMNMMCAIRVGSAMLIADEETLHVARSLWYCVVKRLICADVMRALEQRSLLPVTLNTLSALVCEALSLYKTS